MKKIILIDLDGVLNTYNGNFDETYIPQIKDGAKSFLKILSESYIIKIFTTGNKLLTAKWLLENDLEQYIKDITDQKSLCWLYIDDRCIKFNGNYNELSIQVQNFESWYKLSN